MSNGDASTITLYVGNLDPSVTEELLLLIFGAIAECKGCKLIREAGTELYAFVEYATHAEAQVAIISMNKRKLLGKEMKVDWATQPGGDFVAGSDKGNSQEN